MKTSTGRLAPLPRLRAAGLSLLLAFAAGCEPFDHGHGDLSFLRSSPASSSAPAASSKTASQPASIVGSWKLVANDGSAWYAHFAADGSWKISDDREGNARRVYGTYSCDGKKFSGPMVNPHVGDGKIEGTIDGNAMSMDFVEYWHSPAKHVPYAGTKL